MIPVYSLLLVCVLPIPSAHEAAGALGTRRSPRPPWAEELNNASGASRREDERTSGFFVIASAAIAVGTLIAERPPHRTVRAAFPHTAPTSSE